MQPGVQALTFAPIPLTLFLLLQVRGQLLRNEAIVPGTLTPHGIQVG